MGQLNMRVIEEKAKEYADEKYSKKIVFDSVFSPKTVEDAFRDGAYFGISEAFRWRDPKDELPDINVEVLCKCEVTQPNRTTGGMSTDIRHLISERAAEGFYHSKDKKPFLIEGTNEYRLRVKVIGWRPIE